MFTSCSKPGDPDPVVPDPGSGPGTNPGTGPEQPLSLDKSFIEYLGTANVAAMQEDGKVIIAGKSKNTTTALFRVDQNGNHDSSFNIDQDKSWVIKTIRQLAIQPGGKVIVAGDFVINNKTYDIIRLDGSGLLDKSFAYHENPITSYPVEVTALAVQQDGKVLYCLGLNNTGKRFMQVERINADGSKDASFTNFAPQTAEITDSPYLQQIVPMPDGSIYVFGDIRDINNGRYVIKIGANGKYDPTFKFKERLFSSNRYGTPSFMAVQSTGKILVAGVFDRVVDEAQRDTEFKSTGLCRLNTDGSLDASFTANTVKLVPSEILVRNDNTFVVTGRFVVPGNHQIGLFFDNGDFKNGMEFAAEKSEIKRKFKQSDT